MTTEKTLMEKDADAAGHACGCDAEKAAAHGESPTAAPESRKEAEVPHVCYVCDKKAGNRCSTSGRWNKPETKHRLATK